MTKKILMAGLIAIAFLAGTIVTASIATATPDTTKDNLGARIVALENIIQIDPDTNDVHIKAGGDLSLEAGDNKEISVNTKASFQEDTEMRKKAKMMGDTTLEGDVKAMSDATVEGGLTAESEATIGETLKIKNTDGSEGEFYVAVNQINVPSGSLDDVFLASCNEGDVAVGGGVKIVPDWPYKTFGPWKDNAEPEEFPIRIAHGNTEVLDLTIMALCIAIGS